jgi:phage-related minor tail protein
MSLHNIVENIQVLGKELVDCVSNLIHEGNVRRIIIKDEHGHTFVEIPVTVAAVGAIAAPVLAALGTISALVAKFTIVVERTDTPPASGATSAKI